MTYQNFRAAVQAQVGSYGIGNSTNGMYQGQLGFDFGSLSLDCVLSWAKDAVSLSSFAGSNMTCLSPGNCFINVNNQFFDPNTVLRATLSNNLGGELVARYKWDPFTLYGGWIYARQMNPSDDFLTGFPTIAQGIFIPPGAFNQSGVYTNSAVTINNFDIQRVLNTFSFGARWKIRSDLEAMGGFYYQNQNNFSPAACTGSGAFISSTRCGGTHDRTIVPARLEAGQACRHLRRRLAQQCLQRPRQRLLLDVERRGSRNGDGPERQHGPDAELRPDCRHPYSLLAVQILGLAPVFRQSRSPRHYQVTTRLLWRSSPHRGRGSIPSLPSTWPLADLVPLHPDTRSEKICRSLAPWSVSGWFAPASIFRKP